MNIKTASRKTGLTERFIRFLIKEDAFKPETPSSTRGVSNELSDINLVELSLIRELRSIGMELSTIKEVIRELQHWLKNVYNEQPSHSNSKIYLFLTNIGNKKMKVDIQLLAADKQRMVIDTSKKGHSSHILILDLHALVKKLFVSE